jgi:hypothetical protein
MPDIRFDQFGNEEKPVIFTLLYHPKSEDDQEAHMGEW